MVREKPAKETAVQKTLEFLKDLRHNCELPYDAVLINSLTDLHKIHGISTSTGTACKRLGIIKKDKRGGYEWCAAQPDREMALLVLDSLLRKTKRETNIPLSPEWGAISAVLAEISNKLSISNQNTEIALSRLKNKQIDASMMPRNIFKEEEQKQRDLIYLAGQIASAVYTRDRTIEDFDDNEDFVGITINNNLISRAAKDLLKKLYNK